MADDEQLHRSILYRWIIDDRLQYDCAPLVSVSSLNLNLIGCAIIMRHNKATTTFLIQMSPTLFTIIKRSLALTMLETIKTLLRWSTKKKPKRRKSNLLVSLDGKFLFLQSAA